MKFGSLSKAHTLNITPCSWNKDKLRIAWVFQIYFVSVTLEGYNFKIQFSGFNRSYVFYLAVHLRTAISADTIFCILSKDHAGNTMQTGAKMISYLKIKTLKNPTLSRGTHLYSPYKSAWEDFKTFLRPPQAKKKFHVLAALRKN